MNVLVAAVLLVAGCAAEQTETPTFESVSTPPVKPSEPPPAPVKYTTERLKSCLDIRQQVGAELPVAEPDNDQSAGSHSSSRTCTFRAPEQTTVFSVRSWENTDDVTGVMSGGDHAQKYFTDRSASWEKDGGVKIGSDARWREERAPDCALEVLDENAVLVVIRTGEGEQCRASVRELAQKFYAAVQP